MYTDIREYMHLQYLETITNLKQSVIITIIIKKNLHMYSMHNAQIYLVSILYIYLFEINRDYDKAQCRTPWNLWNIFFAKPPSFMTPNQ